MTNRVKRISSDSNTFQQLLNLLYLSVSTLLSIIVIQTNLVPYEAGTGDHHVILPAGLLRADSSLYLGDYFIRQAVMPHWFFEYLTTYASKLNQLDLFFFVFWILTIVVFAWANLVFASTIITKNSRTVALIITVVQIFGVRTFFGTSAIVLQQALPHSLGAALAFLALAYWYRGDRKLLFFLLPLIPVIHVQVGAIALGLFVLLVVSEWIMGIRPKPSQFCSLVLSLATTVFGLVLRPVAGNTKEFSEICRRLIPHHCYAPSWSHGKLLVCILFVSIGLLAVGFNLGRKRNQTFIAIVIGLPIVILLFSLILDKYFNGLLTDLVRGNNIYRFAVVVLPFIYWTPLLILTSDREKFIRMVGAGVSLLLLTAMVMVPDHGSRFEIDPILLGIITVTCLVGLLLTKSNSAVKWSEPFSVIACSVLLAVGSLVFSERSFSTPDLRFIPDELGRGFGEAVKESVPRGLELAGDPTTYWLRMASGVGYAVDCKFRPIGGGEPLKEFYRRLEPLGGYEAACLLGSFSSISAEKLNLFAETSDSQLLLLSNSDSRIESLVSMGWKVLSTPALEPFSYQLLQHFD